MIEYRASKISENIPSANDWRSARPITLVDARNGGSIDRPCEARILWNELGLFVRFECRDNHIWGTYKNDDDPIYTEEVVEIFVAKGDETPKEYFEFQFSPNGVKFDAKIQNPTGNRRDDGFRVDVGWNCEGLDFDQELETNEANQSYKSGKWITNVKIPAKLLGGLSDGDFVRANLFRIDGWPKQESFQSWVPTECDPADFHVPEKFGRITLAS